MMPPAADAAAAAAASAAAVGELTPVVIGRRFNCPAGKSTTSVGRTACVLEAVRGRVLSVLYCC